MMCFMFVCVMDLHSEFSFAKRYDFGCNFVSPPQNQITYNIVPFSVSVLAVVTNKVETANVRGTRFFGAVLDHSALSFGGAAGVLISLVLFQTTGT